jgi:hypothetical protein
VTDSSGALRTQILNVITKDEPGFLDVAGFGAVNRLVRQNFHRSGSPHEGDSLECVTAGGTPFNQHIGDGSVAWPEMYFNKSYDSLHGDWTGQNVTGLFGIPYRQVPSLRQHNGNRFKIPEFLDLNRVTDTTYSPSVAERIENYTETIQQLWWGRYTPYEQGWPYNNRTLYGMGREAANARKLGRRVMVVAGLHNEFNKYLTDSATSAYDTVSAHVIEPSEIRVLANLAVGYSATGINYYVAGFDTHLFKPGSHVGENCCEGYKGPYPEDTTSDFRDITFSDFPDWEHGYAGDTIHETISGMYVGWRARTREMRWLNRGWLPNVGGEILRRGLRWRDAYSVHWQARRSGKDAGYTPRPLPSTEIVTQVQSRPLWRTTWDDSSRTYVELGLFDTRIGTTGGARDPQKDTNTIWVVNRRSFETPTDSLSLAVLSLHPGAKRILDSLSESRVIRLKFHLKHPDSTIQYNLIRVREVAPDTTRLPLAGYARRGLDTAIYADSSAEIVLRSGGAALLEITYLKPPEAITGGDLHFNGQRKFLWDGRRYHVVFHRIDSGVSRIFYRRSLPVPHSGDSTVVIMWEPYTYVVDSDNVDRHAHRYPSMTLRVRGLDTVISVVWTADAASIPFPYNRGAFLRNLQAHSVAPSSWFDVSPVELVDWYVGNNPDEYGTPVISSLDGAEAIAWSDSLVGIRAKLRKLDTATSGYWWELPGVYSSTLTVRVADGALTSFGGQFPSVPTFTHIGARDSSCGIVWQYHDPNGSGQNYIWYGRLVHDTVGGLRLRDTNTLNPITPGLGNNFHPSIDQTQDVWQNIQEGVAFESMHAGFKPTVKINFVTLYTPYTSYRTNLQATQQWLLNSVTASSFTTLPPVPLMYPNIASLNTRYDSTTQSKLIEFGIGYHNMVTSQMKQVKAKYDVGFVAGAGQAYAFSGYNSNLSANRVLRAAWSADSIWSKPGGGYDTMGLAPGILGPPAGASGDDLCGAERWRQRLPHIEAVSLEVASLRVRSQWPGGRLPHQRYGANGDHCRHARCVVCNRQ